MNRALFLVAGVGLVGALWYFTRGSAQASTGTAATAPIPDPYSEAPPMSDVIVPSISENQRFALALAQQYGQGNDVAEVMAIIATESSFNPNAVNPADPSYGLMAVTPNAARQVGMSGTDEQIAAALMDPATNVQTGCAYLNWIRGFLASRGMSGENAVIAAYNEGVGNALKGLPDLAYVSAVTGHWQEWRNALAAGVA